MLPEEVTRLIGKAGDTVIMEVERGGIKKLADAIGDSNPLYWDEEYARSSRYGSLIAPPGFFGWPTRWPEYGPTFSKLREEAMTALIDAGYKRSLDGGIEYDFFAPVRAGDTLAALQRIIAITDKETKGGTLVFTVVETTYTNQNGDLVAKARQTLIQR